MVSAAADAAVNASISTPVLPMQETSLLIVTALLPISKSILTLLISSGWHNGINSGVFFAAIMPAILAQAIGSPLGRVPAFMALIVCGLIKTLAWATAVLLVCGFSPISAILAAFIIPLSDT